MDLPVAIEPVRPRISIGVVEVVGDSGCEYECRNSGTVISSCIQGGRI